jgi:hypothetical protein
VPRVFCRLTPLPLLLCLLAIPPVFADASDSPSTHDTLLEVFDTVLQRVVSLRHLTPTAPIKRGVRNRQQIRTSLRNLLDDTFSPEEWTTERKAMYKWGLLPADFPLKAFVLDLLTEQAAGYYDPKRQMFFIADWLPPNIQGPIMAHELVHTLQDQHYDLRRHFAPLKEHTDLTLARQALVEGDALAIMLEYMFQPLGLSFDQLPSLEALIQSGAALFGEQFQVYERAPLVLRQQLLFPYLSGLTFIKAALTHRGWSGMPHLYHNPPASTEQILHPEKYFSVVPDYPHEITLQLPERLFQASWHRLKRDILGEFLLSVILQQFLPEAEAKQSAAGWRGDRYELFEHQPSERLLLVCVTAWDTTTDAKEFFQSYAKLLGLKYPDWTLMPPLDPMVYIWRHGSFRLVLSRRAQEVQIIEGVSVTDLPQLQGMLRSMTNVVAPSRD